MAVFEGVPDLRLGFVPLTDAAPLVVAEAKGFFRDQGIRVALAPAASWAALRDRVAFGAWDGGQMLLPMAVALGLGLGGVRADLTVSATLGRNGNALVLGGAAARFPMTPAGFADWVRAVGRAPRIAVVFPFSSHNYLLRHFMAAGGIDPDRDVRLVVLAPSALPEALAAGEIDGFCAGAPWGSRAVDLRVGRIVLSSGAIWDWHPEKVLALRAGVAAEVAVAATAAVIRAAAWLEEAGNAGEAAEILHARALPGVPREVIALALEGRLAVDADLPAVPVPGAIVHSVAATRPDAGEAAWFLAAMRRWGHVAPGAVLPDGVWRLDVWRAGLAAAGFDEPAFSAQLPVFEQFHGV